MGFVWLICVISMARSCTLYLYHGNTIHRPIIGHQITYTHTYSHTTLHTNNYIAITWAATLMAHIPSYLTCSVSFIRYIYIFLYFSYNLFSTHNTKYYIFYVTACWYPIWSHQRTFKGISILMMRAWASTFICASFSLSLSFSSFLPFLSPFLHLSHSHACDRSQSI